MNLFKTFSSLGLAEEKTLIVENWEYIVESVVRSNHAKAVKFFLSKLMAVNPLDARIDTIISGYRLHALPKILKSLMQSVVMTDGLL